MRKIPPPKKNYYFFYEDTSTHFNFFNMTQRFAWICSYEEARVLPNELYCNIVK